MTFDELFESCPTPMLVTNTEGVIIESNAKTRKLAGFKSKQEAYEAHYSEQPCEISAFSDDFILQDNMALNATNPVHFLSMYRFVDSKFHIHLGSKTKIKDGLILTNMFEISNYICPFLTELLCLHSNKSMIDKDRSFTYLFEENNKIKNIFSKQELQCIKYMTRSYSTKLIAEKMSLSIRTIEAYIINIRNKLNVNSKHEIIDHCIKHRLLSFEDLFQ